MLQITDYEEILVLEEALKEYFYKTMGTQITIGMTAQEMSSSTGRLKFISKIYQDVKRVREDIQDNIPGGR